MPYITGLSTNEADSANNAAIINTALAAGGEVIIPDSPNGIWPVKNTGNYILKIDTAAVLKCASSRATLVGIDAPATQDFLLMRPLSGIANDAFLSRHWRVDGLMASFKNSGEGRHCINLQTAAQDEYLFMPTIRDGIFSGGTGFGIYSSSLDNPNNIIQTLHIIGNTIKGGVSLNKIGDSLVLDKNTIYGDNLGLYVDFIATAGLFTLVGNSIVNQTGSVRIIGGLDGVIIGNFFETSDNLGINEALVYLQDTQGLTITGNMFQPNANANCLWLKDTYKASVENNNMYRLGTKYHVRDDGAETDISNNRTFGSPGNSLVLFSGVLPVSVTKTHSQTLGAGTTFTLNSVSFGDADSTRQITVGINRWGGSSLPSSVTIGGITASLVVEAPFTVSGTTYHPLTIYKASVPTGTTGTIVINFGSAIIDGAISVHRVINASTTPNDTKIDDTLSGTQLSATISVPDHGAVIAVCAGQSFDTFATTWAGVTEDYDISIAHQGGTHGYSSAHGEFSTAASQSVTSNMVNPIYCTMALVAFTPL